MLRLVALASLLACAGAEGQDASSRLGLFESQSDVGNVLHAGSAEFDANTKAYTVSGSGENMWFAKDEFHFVWKKISAEDLTLTAGISILGATGNGHRKGVLMIRQSLDNDAAYVDAARHGDGLTSLQFRETKGATTHEIESNVSAPGTLRIEKRGNYFYLWIGADDGDLQFAGGSAWVEMRAPFYVGIGVCAHDKEAVEKVAFTNVEIDTKPRHAKGRARYSTIETVLLSGDARAGYVSPKHLTSPGWSADGQALTFESDNHTEQAPFTPLRTAAPVGVPIAPKPGADFTYFASKSGSSMQIWRKSGDGSQSEQFTPDDFNNTSPHVSPDGKYLLFLSYSKEYDKLGQGIPVELRLMLLLDNSIKTLVKFVGGPDSLGTQPWSPDGRRVVFVSYQSGVGSR
jgi:TolB protein